VTAKSGALPPIVPYVKMVLYLVRGLHFILLCYLSVLENVVCFVCWRFHMRVNFAESLLKTMAVCTATSSVYLFIFYFI